MKPQVKVFTRDNPCTKLELWNCFRGRRQGFKQVQVDEAKSIIGANAPRNMLSKGYVEVVSNAKGDFYKLTDDGVEWLRKGFRNFLKKHPDRVDEARSVPADLVPNS